MHHTTFCQLNGSLHMDFIRVRKVITFLMIELVIPVFIL